MGNTRKPDFAVGSSAPEFSKLAIKAALALGLALGGVGAYYGVQALRANSWEGDAKAAAQVVKGASEIREREMSFFHQRVASSQLAMSALQPREQAMEFLVGQPVPQLVAKRSSLVQSIKSRIENAAAMEVAVAQLLNDRSGGRLDNGAFIDRAQKALATWGAQKAAGRFDGPAGFASAPLLSVESQAINSAKLADEKLDQLKSQLPKMASALLADGGMRELEARAKDAEREAREIAQQEASDQIETYRQQVKDSARRAFDHEGESMGSRDWSEINADLERDPGWIAAKAGLRSSATDSANEAGRFAREQWDQERQNALAMAEMVNEDPFALDSMSVWEMALLAQWSARSPGSPYFETPQASATPVQNTRVASNLSSRRSGFVAAAASDFARRGYSLSAEPRVGLDGASALRASRGEALKSPAPRYAPSATTSTVAAAVAHGSGDEQKAQRLAARAAAARAAMLNTQNAVATKYAQAQGSSAPGSASPYVKDKETLGWTVGAALAASKAAQATGQSSAARSAALAAGRSAGERSAAKVADAVSTKVAMSWGAQAASQAAQSKAASQAVERAAARAAAHSAQRSAQMAASKSVQIAASKAAESSAQKAAQTAAGKAVSKAADTAASKVADRAASVAAERAAGKAADKAASAAASKAAQAAAGKAASKAASAAASKAAAAAASKAASAAASKAASAAASKAASAASSRASSAASSRAASSSSSSRR